MTTVLGCSLPVPAGIKHSFMAAKTEVGIFFGWRVSHAEKRALQKKVDGVNEIVKEVDTLDKKLEKLDQDRKSSYTLCKKYAMANKDGHFPESERTKIPQNILQGYVTLNQKYKQTEDDLKEKTTKYKDAKREYSHFAHRRFGHKAVSRHMRTGKTDLLDRLVTLVEREIKPSVNASGTIHEKDLVKYVCIFDDQGKMKSVRADEENVIGLSQAERVQLWKRVAPQKLVSENGQIRHKNEKLNETLSGVTAVEI